MGPYSSVIIADGSVYTLLKICYYHYWWSTKLLHKLNTNIISLLTMVNYWNKTVATRHQMMKQQGSEKTLAAHKWTKTKTTYCLYLTKKIWLNNMRGHNCWSYCKIPINSVYCSGFFQVGDITPMLNVTSRLNVDGKTRAYDFKIESTSFSKFVKAITLSLKAGPISRTLTIITGKMIQ